MGVGGCESREAEGECRSQRAFEDFTFTLVDGKPREGLLRTGPCSASRFKSTLLAAASLWVSIFSLVFSANSMAVK